MHRLHMAGRCAAALVAGLLACTAAPAHAQQEPPAPSGIDLQQRLWQYRDDHHISASRNVAVFEFRNADGSYGTIAIDSEKFSKGGEPPDRPQGHSERRAARILRSYGIEPEQVTRILSELEPCSLPGAYCAKMLAREFPDAEVSWLYEYGSSPESREAGNQAKQEAVDAHYRQAAEAEDTLRVPGAKPPSGPLVDELAEPGLRPGGIDFTTLDLRYVSTDGPKGGGISYSLSGTPASGPSDPAVGLQAAKRASDAFFAWLALPPQEFWVNLNPTQPDRIIDPQFARTDAGHVLLAADLQLKHILWPLTNPSTPSGAEFWRQIDALYGGDQLKSNVCLPFRVWIEPLPATVRETATQLYILDAPLTVKMALLDLPVQGNCPVEDPAMQNAKLAVFQQVIAPLMAQQVNTAPEFADLRRVYYSRVAAEWVRAKADRRTPLGRIVDSGDVARWAANPSWNPLDIFNAYLQSYENGDYSYTRQIADGDATETFTYVMGGVDFSRTPRQNVSARQFRSRYPKLAGQTRRSLEEPEQTGSGQVMLGAGDRAARQPRIRSERGTHQAPGALRLRTRASRRGGAVRLSLAVANRGTGTLTGIEVCDRLPAGLVFARASRRRHMRAGSHCWDVARLAAGRSATIRLTARVAGGAHGALRNRAVATVHGAPALGVRSSRVVAIARQGPGAPAGGVTGEMGQGTWPRRLAGVAAAAAVAAPAAPAAAAVRPDRAYGATVARVVAPTGARTGPGTGRRVFWRAGTTTAWSGQPQRLLVLDRATRGARAWLRVLLPIRPAGRAGWIPSDDAVLSHTPYWIDVRLGARRVTVRRSGRVVRRFRAVVGAPGTPTPRGLSAVYERNRQPDSHGFLGPWALPLTALSGVLEDYGGGPGRIAIHGRDGASLRDPLGTARSHGCIRVADRDVRWLARRIPVGTPVDISD